MNLVWFALKWSIRKIYIRWGTRPFFRGKSPKMITFSPDHFTNAGIFIIITLCSDEGNAQNVSQDTLYGVQHIHINLTFILILLFIIRFGAGREWQKCISCCCCFSRNFLFLFNRFKLSRTAELCHELTALSWRHFKKEKKFNKASSRPAKFYRKSRLKRPSFSFVLTFYQRSIYLVFFVECSDDIFTIVAVKCISFYCHKRKTMIRLYLPVRRSCVCALFSLFWQRLTGEAANRKEILWRPQSLYLYFSLQSVNTSSKGPVCLRGRCCDICGLY